jgi:hypothetical protein
MEKLKGLSGKKKTTYLLETSSFKDVGRRNLPMVLIQDREWFFEAFN